MYCVQRWKQKGKSELGENQEETGFSGTMIQAVM